MLLKSQTNRDSSSSGVKVQSRLKDHFLNKAKKEIKEDDSSPNVNALLHDKILNHFKKQ